mmetsp:Transcript_2714/g.7561  ORF Transcript_2714/g.7561 Transcript_2714/m.7561 type:complete len:406 (+) Transcript_2714:115-1332(+)
MARTRFLLLLWQWLLTGVVAALSASSNNNNNNMSHNNNRQRPPPSLPSKLLIAYATDCNPDDKSERGVLQAVRNGINVVIWSFMEIHSNSDNDDSPPRIEYNSLDFDCIQTIIQQLDKEGYTDTVHLVSFGGWNGPHLDPHLSAQVWYDTWKQAAGHVFDGLDWDLEGHNDLHSPTNVFTVECLDKMGQISRLAKRDGYSIGMAPPQSYLDVHTPRFSRAVNLTDNDHDRTWHADFSYFGANVYAVLLAKYGDAIDFVSIQFYESYSRAAMNIYHDGVPPEIYLQRYVRDLVEETGGSFAVHFQDDEAMGLPNQRVPLPLSKLVWGFANGWALDTEDKALYVSPKAIESAYVALSNAGIPPRGFMFWVLGEEGKHDIQYTKELNNILEIRSSQNDVSKLKETKEL